ncbi:MAG: YIP1 family protein [Bacteroidota bacterium]
MAEVTTRLDQSAPAAEMGFLDRLAGLFYEPGNVFRSLSRRPDYVFPIILIVLAAALSLLTASRIDYTATLTPEQAEAIAKVPRWTLAASSAVSALIVTAISWIVRSVAFMALGKAVGGEGRFGSFLATQGFVMVPQFLNVLLVAVFAAATGKPYSLSLAYFLSATAQSTPVGVLCAQISPFVFGYLILAPIAVSEAAGISRRKAWAIVLPAWLLIVLLQAGMAALGGMMRG